MNTNDGSENEPSLKFYINSENLVDLRRDTRWSEAQGLQAHQALKADGFDGIQQAFDDPLVSQSPLGVCTLDRANTPDEIRAAVARCAGDYECLTLHVGWGIESDAEVDALVEAVLEASHQHALPTYIETHRATITQDMWRTVQICERFPEIRFNGDLSHYYTGQEMVYGGMDMKLSFMAPIFERISFMHARIGDSCNIQMPVGKAGGRPEYATGLVDYLEDHLRMWTLAMQGWLRTAGPGDTFIFSPELLSPTYGYARTFKTKDGTFEEESDRYAEALLYLEMANKCFAEAKRSLR